ncbi:hypothetical protein [Roseomonas fluvialis]|uniref:Lipoprotein n=1 Tax=Roseomonas fluvialis TaxID=1750527 RepID=A0ABM7XZ57_9PROT|nr:hypothetical protein [Roseomonas fluvialis]BDG70761.1 hypothetical protein Rmf_06900 [Roseomonas fluvialis]
MTAIPRLMLLCVALLSLPGCATLAMNAALRAAHPQPAWNGEVAVATEPPGGRCTVARGDRVMAEVPAAPASVRLARSYAELEVRCVAEGFLETAEVLRPRDDPAVFRMAPNGVIGATATVISLASARTMRYPSEVTVAMVPASFPSEAAREQFFATRRAAVMAARATEIGLAEERCRAERDTTCDPSLLVAQRQQAEDLARLDALRGATQVGVATAAPADALPDPLAAAPARPRTLRVADAAP